MKKELFYGSIVFVITQIVYFLTMAPTVTSEDAGELITAAVHLGVAHPPGYPLYCLLGKAFSYLPFSSYAYALNYMSAFFASLTCVVTYFAIRQLKGEVLGAIVGALLLGFSWHFWNQSILAEVYSLNAFVFAVLLLLAIQLKENWSWFKFYGFCSMFGLGLTNHYMLILLLSPVFFIYLLPTFIKNFKWQRFLIACACIILPLGLYGYLYWSANSNPVINWGDPSTFTKLVSHVKRDAYKSLELEKVVSFSVKLTYYYQFLYLLLGQMTALVLIPCLGAGFSYWWQRKKEFFFLVGFVVFNSFVLLTILHFSAEQENFTRVEEYYLPAYIALSVLLAFGVQEIAKYFNVHKLSYLLFLVPTIPLICNYKANDFSNYYLAYDYNKAILDDLPENAIYFPSGDYNAFPVLYLQAVENIRKDILLADITGDPEKAILTLAKELDPKDEIYQELKVRLKDRFPNLKADTMLVLQKVLIDRGTRPVFFTSKSDIKLYPEYTVTQYGLVYQATKKGEKVEKQNEKPNEKQNEKQNEKPADTNQDLNLEKKVEVPVIASKLVFSNDILRNINNPSAEDDLGQSIYAGFYQMWGESLIRSGKVEEGLKKFDQAVFYSYYSKEGLNNLGSALSELGQTHKAIGIYERAIRLHPDYKTGRVNLQRSYMAIKDQAKADQMLVQLEAIDRGYLLTTKQKPNDHQVILKDLLLQLNTDPNNALLHHDIGVAYANLRDLDKAMFHLEKALAIKADYQSAISNLLKVYRAANQPIEKQEELMKRLKP